MNDIICNGLNYFYESLIPYGNSFNKKLYEDTFKDEYKKSKELFKTIIEEAEAAEDANQFIEEVAAYLPNKMMSELDQIPNKRNKEILLMKLNLGMVVYVIPLFYYKRDDILEAIADRMIELWNEHGYELKITGATFETINDGFRPRLCYITTVVCEGLGKSDDCYELNLLRNYRDGYLMETSEGEKLVNEYYDIAPTLVKRITRDEHADEIYQSIWDEFLRPCVSLIEDGKREECREKYTEMVHSLQKKYLYS